MEQLSLALSLDSPLIGNAKNDRTLMVFNFFALARERQTELPVYEDGGVRIEVVGTKYGVANSWDKELLIYLTSLLQEKVNDGEVDPGPSISFTAHDFSKAVGRNTGGSQYEQIEESLRRLRSTTITTNIRTGGIEERRGFSWINSYKVVYRDTNKAGDREMLAITVELSSWIHRAIVRDRKILT